MEKKFLALIGAIVALAALATSAYFIISKIVRKKGYSCEEVDFDNYVECPCDECEAVEDGEPSPADVVEDIKDAVEDKVEDIAEAIEDAADAE